MKKASKRIFDVILSGIGLLIFLPIILFFLILAAIDTRSAGLFVQDRIGQFGKVFRIYKLKTMRASEGDDNVISAFGNFLRKSKIDEMPQLFNVLTGDMSMVGPRPDIPGYYDLLKGEDRKILDLKPGISGPASLKYANEEQLLSQHENPQQYNDEVIFPDKIRINLIYQRKQSLWLDIKIIIYTIFGKKMNDDFKSE